MDTLVIYHNPGCSKSRSALALLQARQVPLQVIEYLKQPPARAELVALSRKLGLPPAQWIRAGEAEYRAAGLSADSGDDALLDAMTQYPILIERPIVVCGDRALVGRPPERVLELLAD